MTDKDKEFTALFAERKKGEVDELIAGTDGYIVMNVLNFVTPMLEESHDKNLEESAVKMKKITNTSHEIRAHLDDYVIGQDYAKKSALNRL